jgi:hypothetical protein
LIPFVQSLFIVVLNERKGKERKGKRRREGKRTDSGENAIDWS